MFLDAHTMKEQALEADICIAGGGAAGMTLALDLRASGLSVILLESGGFRREAQTQRLSDGRMIGINTWNMRSMRIRALGGTTGHWEGWCRPLMPKGFRKSRLHTEQRMADSIFRSVAVVRARV